MAAEMVGTRSISEQVGERLDDRFAARLMFGSWLVPASGLIVCGMAAMFPQSDVLSRFAQIDTAQVLARVQALSLLLAVVTVLVTVRCAILRLPSSRITAPTRIRAALIVCLLGVGAAAAIEARTVASSRPLLIPVAALAGLAAAAIGSLWLLRLPGTHAGPIVGLASVVSGQLTIGWLPLIEPGLASSPVPVFMGILLVGAAVSAVVVEPFAPTARAAQARDTATVLDLSDREADVEFALNRGHAALPLG